MDQVIQISILRESSALPSKMPKLSNIEKVFPEIELTDFMYELFHDMGFEDSATFWRESSPKVKSVIFEAVAKVEQQEPVHDRVFARMCPKCNYDLTCNLPVFHRGVCPACATDTTTPHWQEFFSKSIGLHRIWHKRQNELLEKALKDEPGDPKEHQFIEVQPHEIPFEAVQVRQESFGHEPLTVPSEVQPQEFLGSFEDQVTNNPFSLEGLRTAIRASFLESDSDLQTQRGVNQFQPALGSDDQQYKGGVGAPILPLLS